MSQDKRRKKNKEIVKPQTNMEKELGQRTGDIDDKIRADIRRHVRGI